VLRPEVTKGKRLRRVPVLSILTVLLIKRRAQSHTDDRLAAMQTVPSCECDFEGKRRLRSPMRPAIRRHSALTYRRYD